MYWAGKFGKYALGLLKDLESYNVGAVVDKNKSGQTILGHLIELVDVLRICDYEEVILTPINRDVLNDIEMELLSIGVSSG